MPTAAGVSGGRTRTERAGARLFFTCHGAQILIEHEDPELRGAIVAALPPDSTVVSSCAPALSYSLVTTAAGYHLTIDGREVATDPDLGEVLDRLSSALDQSVARAAPHRVFVHAGAVGWRGRVILLPGRSHSGKTSLVTALVRAGADYLSDEYAVIDSTGLVHPYPRRLGIRGEPGERSRPMPVADIGGRTATAPLPVGLVVSTTYEPGGQWRPRRLTGAEGVLVLLDNTVRARFRPARNLTVLRRAIRSAVVLEGRRGDAAAVIHEMLSAVDKDVAGPISERSTG